jgi:hypothetical protein
MTDEWIEYRHLNKEYPRAVTSGEYVIGQFTRI